jgi:hypothetical protein
MASQALKFRTLSENTKYFDIKLITILAVFGYKIRNGFRRVSMTMIPMRAADFLGTLGVDTHIPYTDGGYASIANIEADLNYLGVSSVRDGISTGVNGSAPFSSYVTLAQ